MKLTKAQTAAHDEVLAALSLERKLTADETDFCFRNYIPGATNNIGRGGIFFTPVDLARDFAHFTVDRGHVLDACAGIGVLAWRMMVQSPNPTRLHVTCVETNPEFVNVGKRLLPEAEWVRGDMFDLSFVKSLGTFWQGVSNPPYGRVPTVTCQWTEYRGAAHLMMAEILLRLCEHSADMIVPSSEVYYAGDSSPTHERSKALQSFRAALTRKPGGETAIPDVVPHPVDCEVYRDQWRGASPKVHLVEVGYDEYHGNQLYKQLP